MNLSLLLTRYHVTILKVLLLSLISLVSITLSRGGDSNDLNQTEFKQPQAWEKGKEIYQNLCIDCHGDQGQGVAGKYDETLYGDRSISSLTKVVAETMPDEHPEKCEGEEARLVSKYIFDAFYSPEARARNNPPRKELAHLTGRQFINSVTDLISYFQGSKNPGPSHGLKATYYKTRRTNNENKVLERIDSSVDFNWGESSPDIETTKPEEFAINWNGSVRVDETGIYTFKIVTENGAKLWVNDNQNPLIDSWVSSSELKSDSGQIFLLGGRSYPMRLTYFKFKGKTGSIRLEWIPPGYASEVIPRHALFATSVAPTFILNTTFPPDDNSLGFERGVAVSKEWVRSTTMAGIEAARYIADNIEFLAKSKKSHPQLRLKIITFLEEFAALAFASPLSESEKRFFVRKFLSEKASLSEIRDGVKMSVLLILKSPRFLYPEVGSGRIGDFKSARQISLALWDSIPDVELLRAASTGELATESGIRGQVARMTKDYRHKIKLHTFFHHWLHFDEAEDVDKDRSRFPGFNEHLMSDLKKSILHGVREIVWSEGSNFQRLLIDDSVYFNKRLAEFYKVEGARFPDNKRPSRNDEFIKVSTHTKYRAGVITHPFITSTFSYYRSTSPIHRGVFLTRNILGRFLKPPPMAIEFMDGKFNPHLTMREKVTELTSSKTCMACHSIINPLGFSLENFDSVGRFQTHENEKLINAVSKYLDVDGEVFEISGPRDVGVYASQNRLAQLGFLDQLFHHLIKNPAAAYGPDTRNKLLEIFVDSNYHIRKIVEEIVAQAVMRSS